MTKTKARKTQRVDDATYNAFVDALLEPLPAEVLTDTHYNGLVRQARREAWLRAKDATRYYDTQLEYVRAAQSYYKRAGEGDLLGRCLKMIAEVDKFAILKLYREALARQVLTPAHDKTDVAWKRSILANELKTEEPFAYLPITREKTEAAIAADEAFLAAHPVRRSRSKVER